MFVCPPNALCHQDHKMRLLTFSLLLLSTVMAEAVVVADGNITVDFPELLSMTDSKMMNTSTKIEKFLAWRIRKSVAQNMVDADRNGTITLPKILSLMVRKMKNTDRNLVDTINQASFRFDDADCNGFITAAEFLANFGGPFDEQGPVTQFIEEWVESSIREFDMDGDGQLNYKEFVLCNYCSVTADWALGSA